MNNKNNCFVIYPDNSVYVVVSVFMSFFFVLFLFVFLGNNEVHIPLVSVVVIWVCLLWFIKLNKIKVSNEKCFICRPLKVDVVFDVENVEVVRIVPAFNEYKSKFRSPYSVEIKAKNYKSVFLNAKLYRLEDITKLAQHLKVDMAIMKNQ